MFDLNSKFERFMEEMSRSRQDHEVSNHNWSQTTPLHYSTAAPLHYSTAAPISPPPPPDLCGTYFTPPYYHASMPIDPFSSYSTMMQNFSSTQMHHQQQQCDYVPYLFDERSVRDEAYRGLGQEDSASQERQRLIYQADMQSQATQNFLLHSQVQAQNQDPDPPPQPALQPVSPHFQAPDHEKPPQLQQHKRLVRSLGSVSWCRRCKVDCTDMEGLVLHSFTSEHQNKTMSLVMSLKQEVQSSTSYTSKSGNGIIADMSLSHSQLHKDDTPKGSLAIASSYMSASCEGKFELIEIKASSTNHEEKSSLSPEEEGPHVEVTTMSSHEKFEEFQIDKFPDKVVAKGKTTDTLSKFADLAHQTGFMLSLDEDRVELVLQSEITVLRVACPGVLELATHDLRVTSKGTSQSVFIIDGRLNVLETVRQVSIEGKREEVEFRDPFFLPNNKQLLKILPYYFSDPNNSDAWVNTLWERGSKSCGFSKYKQFLDVEVEFDSISATFIEYQAGIGLNKHDFSNFGAVLVKVWDPGKVQASSTRGPLSKVVVEINSEATSTRGRALYNLEPTGLTFWSTCLTFWSSSVNVAWDSGWERVLKMPREDPYMVSRFRVVYVKALQDFKGQGVTEDLDSRFLKIASCCKHYTAYCSTSMSVPTISSQQYQPPVIVWDPDI